MDEADAIMRAALELLDERGFGAMTMDEVALRSGVHPARLFGQWRSRADLLAALLRRHGDDAPEPPDSGDLGQDLAAVIERILEAVHSLRVLIAAAMGEAARDAEIAHELRLFVYSWQSTARRLIAREKERGGLPAALDEVWGADLLASMVWYRILLVGERAVSGVPERLATRILRSWGHE